MPQDMPTTVDGAGQTPKSEPEPKSSPEQKPKCRIAYLIKSVALVGLLYLFARYAGTLPPLVIALVWAALSAVSAVGITYHRVVRKTLKQHEYNKEGHLARLNNGRVVCLVVSFAASSLVHGGASTRSTHVERGRMGPRGGRHPSVPGGFVGRAGGTPARNMRRRSRLRR